MRYARFVFLGLVTLAAMVLAPVPGGSAATLTVNSTGDASDLTAGNGVCETATGNGVCTLRAAIEEANALGGADTIGFNIAAARRHDLQPGDPFGLGAEINILDLAMLVEVNPPPAMLGVSRVFDTICPWPG